MTTTRPEWLAERATYIGGSDMSGILGMTDDRGRPYYGETPWSVWSKKRDPDLTDNPSEAMVNGTLLEDGGVARIYSHRTGRKVRVVSELIRDKEYPFLAGNPDRLVIGEDRGLEIKTTALGERWGPDGSGAEGVFMPALVQCQWYMMLTGFPVWDVCVMISTADVRIYEVERNQGFIDAARAAAVRLWTDHVVTGIQPNVTLIDAPSAYRTDNGSFRVATPQELAELEAIAARKRMFRELEHQVEVDQQRLHDMLREHRYLVDENAVKVVDFYTVHKKKPLIKLSDIEKADPKTYADLAATYGRQPKPYRVAKFPKETTDE